MWHVKKCAKKKERNAGPLCPKATGLKLIFQQIPDAKSGKILMENSNNSVKYLFNANSW